ncbi:SH3 domain-containing protein [Neorhizobium sp. T25_13]|uniref:SH3 domain-containing protein n=1 Tax=Neorhizobium sp. T25_13 TaxID=2093830 RepID=UPI000CF87D37|nr:SH3 domain-containing protein [Neorhizobium sp. T25_13]
MKTRSLVASALVALVFLSPVAMGQPLQAKPAFDDGWEKGRETGLPVPRFVSLKARSANLRIGPSTDYATAWVYSAQGLPLEITGEYGNWRRVRDADGTSGWMFAPLLSSKRTAVIGPWLKQPIPLRSAPSRTARIVARLLPEVRLDLMTCDGTWCKANLQKERLRGYVQQGSLWGVYPDETIE